MIRVGIFLLLNMLVLNACNNKPVGVPAPSMQGNGATTTESSVMDTVLALPEVKERADYIESETKGKRDLSVFIASEPDSINAYYWVKVGEDNGDAFATHSNFFVYPDRNHAHYVLRSCRRCGVKFKGMATEKAKYK